MSQVPHELIRQVQICTRSAAGLLDYNPSDPTLPALPPLSAAIVASDPSSPQLRCENCKATLLRGSESLICIYCGLGPHYVDVPDPINFTSTIGYQWLLRSLRLDGSEMVDHANDTEQNRGYNSLKALTPLSDFLHFKIPWPAEVEKQETTFSEKQSEQIKGSLRFIGVAPDKFFLKSKNNVIPDMSIEHQFMTKQIEASDGKDVGYSNLIPNVQSYELDDSVSKEKASSAFSEWEADFQCADSENQHEFPGASVVYGNNIKDPKSSDLSTGFGVDLSAHIDSVFGSGKDLNDRKQEDNPAVSPVHDDWNSDDVWNNLSSNNNAVSTNNDTEVDYTLVYPEDSSADLFRDFQAQTISSDKTEIKSTNEKHNTIDKDSFEEWNDFTGSDTVNFSSQNAWTGGDYQVSTSDQRPSDMDLFSFDKNAKQGDFSVYSKDRSADIFQEFHSQTNCINKTENKTTSEEHKVMDEDTFEEWNDFTGSTSSQFPSQNACTGVDYQFSTSGLKSSDMVLYNFDNKIEKRDFVAYSKDSNNLFQDSQSRNIFTEQSEKTPTNEKHKRMDEDLFEQWSEFTGSTSLPFPSKNALTGDVHHFSSFNQSSLGMDLSILDNLSSNTSHFSGGFDTTVTAIDHTSVYSKDNSADLFLDFQSRTIYGDEAENKSTNEEHKTIDEESVEEWNDFTGSNSLQFPSQNAWAGGDYRVSTSDENTSEMDLFSFANRSGKGDFGSFSQADFISTSTSHSNAIMSESSPSDWFFVASDPSYESEQSTNREAAMKSTKDDIKLINSQIHDLSFMLETNLYIPSGAEAGKS